MPPKKKIPLENRYHNLSKDILPNQNRGQQDHKNVHKIAKKCKNKLFLRLKAVFLGVFAH